MSDYQNEPMSGINPNLTEFINEMLEEVRGFPNAKPKKGRPSKADMERAGIEKVEYTLKDKLDVFDRALKLEALRLKIKDEGEGSGFGD